MFKLSTCLLRRTFNTRWQPQLLLSRSNTTSAIPQLRNYQEECIQSVLAYLSKGETRLGISLATGSGKTVIFTQLIDRIANPTSDAGQTLILAHRRELIEQAARHCRLLYPEKSIDIELGKSHASGNADITVASVQSINSKGRIEKYDPKRFKLVLVDEAHHIVAPQYLRVMEHFGIRPQVAGAPAMVGVSATLSRFDGLKLGSVIDHIVYHKDYVNMIEEGWLSKVIFTTVRWQKADLRKVKTASTGDFATGALGSVVNTAVEREAVVKTWLARCKERKSTMVFCVTVQHMHDLAATFTNHGVESKCVDGSTPAKERSTIIEEFKNGIFSVLLNCGVFTEGTDIPNIDCVIMARPTKSRNLLVQMIGRGMRLSPGKENCHVIDMVSSLKTGVIATPNLFGLDPDELVEEATPDDLMALKEKKARATTAVIQGQNQEKLTSLTFADYDSISDLMADSREDVHIRSLSPYAWVCTDIDTFVLPSATSDVIRIYQTPYSARWTVKHNPTISTPSRKAAKAPKPVYLKPRILLDNAPTLSDAVHAADTFIGKRGSIWPHVTVESGARWRGMPASQAQKDALRKVGMDGENLTKGQAQDRFTKLKFGAKGRWERMAKERRKEEKEEMRGERETVKVGPIADVPPPAHQETSQRPREARSENLRGMSLKEALLESKLLESRLREHQLDEKDTPPQ